MAYKQSLLPNVLEGGKFQSEVPEDWASGRDFLIEDGFFLSLHRMEGTSRLLLQNTFSEDANHPIHEGEASMTK